MRTTSFTVGALGRITYNHETERWTVNGEDEGHSSLPLAWALLELARRSGLAVEESLGDDEVAS